MEYELYEYLGFDTLTEKTYKEWQDHFQIGANVEMDATHETKMFERFVPLLNLSSEMTSPFGI